MVRVSRKIRKLLDRRRTGRPKRTGTTRPPKGGQPLGHAAGQGLIEEKRLARDPRYGRGSGAGRHGSRHARPLRPWPALPQEVCVEHNILPIAKNGEILTDRGLGSVRRAAARRPAPHVALQRAARALAPGGDQGRHGQRSSTRARARSRSCWTRSTSETSRCGSRRRAENIDIAATSGDDAPAVKLVNLIILRALKEKASDIHIEPGDRGVRVRYRVDGGLYEVAMRPPTAMLPSL